MRKCICPGLQCARIEAPEVGNDDGGSLECLFPAITKVGLVPVSLERRKDAVHYRASYEAVRRTRGSRVGVFVRSCRACGDSRTGSENLSNCMGLGGLFPFGGMRPAGARELDRDGK